MKHLHYWVSIALLSGTAALLWSRGSVDHVLPSVPLEDMPVRLGQWTGTDVPLEGYVLDVLGKGFFLNRNYVTANRASQQRGVSGLVAERGGTGQPTESEPSDPASIGVFIGYFPTQRTGQAIHSPQNCLPGAGWVFNSSSVIALQDERGKQHQVGDYVISNGKQQDEVLYWYQEHGRSIASDYTAKLYTLLDSIRYHRTDAALIRIITPVMAGESRQQSHERLVQFANRLVSELPAYIPD